MGRGRRVTGNDVECLFDLRKATPFDGVAEQVLDAIVVSGRIELEQAVADVIGLRHDDGLWRIGVLRLEIDADTGENAGKLLHVHLGVAGADPHGVQLHDLAGVVLVDVTLGVLGVVEIAQHGRMRDGDAQEIAELAERVATQLLLIVADGLADVRLVEMHVEMVEPEPRHLLAQLIGRIEIAQQAAGRGLAAELVEFLLESLLQHLALLGIGNLVGIALLRGEWEGDLGQRLRRDRQSTDDVLGSGRQPIRPRMQLPLEPAVAAEHLVFGDHRLVDAPRHAVDERDVGGGQRRVTCCGVSGRCGICGRRRWRRRLGRRRAERGRSRCGTWRRRRFGRLRCRGLRRGGWRSLRRGALRGLRCRGVRRKREGGEKNRRSDERRHRVHRFQSTTNDCRAIMPPPVLNDQ
jgi:hypothetical protein